MRKIAVILFAAGLFLLSPVSALAAVSEDYSILSGDRVEFFGLRWHEKVDNIDEFFTLRHLYRRDTAFPEPLTKYSRGTRNKEAITFDGVTIDSAEYFFVNDKLIEVDVHISGVNAYHIVYKALEEKYGPDPFIRITPGRPTSTYYTWDMFDPVGPGGTRRQWPRLSVGFRYIGVEDIKKGREPGDNKIDKFRIRYRYQFLPISWQL